MLTKKIDNQLIVILSLIYKSSDSNLFPPLPHQFVSKSLQSSLDIDLIEVINKINELMPQLSNFIVQFNNITISNSITVITEINGNMSLDVPATMSDDQAEELSKRVGVIDRLITTRGQEIDSLLHKGLKIEQKIQEQDPNFSSKILEKINEFKRLNESYKH